MTDEEIKKFADKLIDSSNRDDAYFGIDETDEYGHYYFKATKDGLRLFATELLYASFMEPPKKTWGLSEEWYDGEELEINHIQVIDFKDQVVPPLNPVSKTREIFTTIGCLLGLVLGGLFVIVGAFRVIKTIIEWI